MNTTTTDCTCHGCGKGNLIRSFSCGDLRWLFCTTCLATTKDMSGEEFTGSTLNPPDANNLVSCINERREENGLPTLAVPFHTDPEKQPEAIAKAFSAVLNRWLSADEWTQLIDRNMSEAKQAGECYSHDYCDANMAMDEAFRVVLGRAPQVGTGEQNDFELWGKAWTIATEANFYAPEMPPKTERPTENELVGVLQAIVTSYESAGCDGCGTISSHSWESAVAILKRFNP